LHVWFCEANEDRRNAVIPAVLEEGNEDFMERKWFGGCYTGPSGFVSTPDLHKGCVGSRSLLYILIEGGAQTNWSSQRVHAFFFLFYELEFDN
jgi:hypothetical protein